MQKIRIYIVIALTILGLSNKGFCQTSAGSINITLADSLSAEPFVINRINEKLYSVRISIDELHLLKKTSPYGDFYQLQIPMTSFMGNMEGSPSLPSYSKLIQIPENSSLNIKIDSLITETVQIDSYGGFKLFPFQSSERKKSASPRIFRYDTLVYHSDYFICDSLIKLESLGIMRGATLGRIVINPFKYNPVKNILKVVKFLKALVEIQTPSNVAGNPSKYSSVAFARMLKSKLSLTNAVSPLPSKYPMKYVILADSMFKKPLQPFVRWKTEEGFKVIEIYKGAPGVGTTPQQMKAYLSDLYFKASPSDPAPTYLLIVGDNEQLPTFYSPRYGHATDLYYTTFDGPDDYLPDMFYGRFSAIDSVTLTNQINKTIEYEKYLFPDPGFLDSALLLSTGNDAENGPTFGNGQINYIANNYANPEHGLNSNVYLYPKSASAKILSHLNNGCSFVNYTGHGDVTFWYSPYLNSTQIASLTNYHKYPLVISNGCITNYFTYPVCFGEALLRGKNIGAIGHIGCTDDSYWDEDYYWAIGVRPVSAHPVYSPSGLGAFDRTFHTHNEPRSEWYPAQGEMSFAGNLAVIESGSHLGLYYWEIYTLLGDPSLKVYYGIPDSLHASFPTQLATGSQQIGIYAEPGSYTGLSLRDSLLDGGAIDSSGFMLLSFSSLRQQDTLLLVISKQNRRPIQAKITPYSPGQSFLEYAGYSVSSESKSINGKPDYGESMKLNVKYKNVGGTASKNFKIILSCIDSLVSVQDSILFCSELKPSMDSVFSNAFAIRISPFIPDQHEIRLSMDVYNKLDSVSRFYIVLVANAPVLQFGEPSYDDRIAGNGDARPEPGETLNLLIPVINTGHSRIESGTAKISGKSNFLSYTDSLIYMTSILPDSTAWIKLPFHVNDSAVPGVPLTITVKLDTLSLHIMNKIIIRPAAYSEDFEMGNLKQLPWKSATALTWYASSKFPLDGNFSARSGRIGDGQLTDMEILLYVTDTGRIQFKYKVSSEDNYDFFRFFVDNKLRKAVSGLSGLQFFSDTVSLGWHSFLWRYQKDEASSYYDDCVWVDDILFPPSVILSSSVTHPYYDGSLKVILFPGIDSTYRYSILPSVIIKNSGNLPIKPSKISYQLDSFAVVTENLNLYLSSGDSSDYIFHNSLLLPEDKTCSLKVFLDTPGDSIHSNDTLKVVFRNLHNYAEKSLLSEELRLYPNPAEDYIYYLLPKTEKVAKVEIINTLGKIVRIYVFNRQPLSGEVKLNLTGLQPGSYFAYFEMDDRKYIQMFVKK